MKNLLYHFRFLIAKAIAFLFDFLDWWVKNILHVFRDLCVFLKSKDGDDRIIVLSRDRVKVVLKNRGPNEPIKEYGMEELDFLSVQDAREQNNTAADVMLCDEYIFKDRLEIHKSAIKYLDKIVMLHLEKKFPIPLEQIFFCYKVLNVNQNQATVGLYLAKKMVIEKLMLNLESVGLHPKRFLIDEPDTSDQLVLKPLYRSSLASNHRYKVSLWLACALVCTLFLTKFIFSIVEIERLDRHLAGLQIDVQDLIELNETAKSKRVFAVEISKLAGSADAADVLLDLQRHIGPPAWISQLVIDNTLSGAAQIDFVAHTSNQAELIKILEDWKCLQNMSVGSSDEDLQNNGYRKIKIVVHYSCGNK